MTLSHYGRIWLGLFILTIALAFIFQHPGVCFGFLAGHIIGRLWFGGPDYLEPRTDAIHYE